MPSGTDQIIFRGSDREEQFDGRTVRRILERAAVEQHRLDMNLADSYSRAELEEMAAEARISPAALQAAINDRPGWLTALTGWLPRRWSSTTKRLVLMGAAGIVLLGIMLAFPFVAKVLFWATVVVLVMMALGVSPF